MLSSNKPVVPNNAPNSSAGNFTDTAMDEFLARMDLYRKRIPKDGSCLFRAVSEQVYNCQAKHLQVRKDCIDFMRRNRDKFEAFIEEPFHHHLFRLQNPKEWAGHVEISALSLMYKKDFVVYQDIDAEPIKVTDNNFKDKILLCYSNGNHYDAVYSIQFQENAAFCQSLVYECLYKRVFPELDKRENSFKGSKQNPTTDMDSMATSFYQNGLEDDNAFKVDSEDNSGWTEVVRGRSSKAYEEEVKEETLKPSQDQKHGWQVKCSLDNEMYRNAELEVWEDSKNGQEKQYQSYAATIHYQEGDKCFAFLGQPDIADKVYEAIVVFYLPIQGNIEVKIPELQNKSFVIPVENLKPSANQQELNHRDLSGYYKKSEGAGGTPNNEGIRDDGKQGRRRRRNMPARPPRGYRGDDQGDDTSARKGFQDDSFPRLQSGAGPHDKFGRGREHYSQGRDERQLQREDEEARHMAEQAKLAELQEKDPEAFTALPTQQAEEKPPSTEAAPDQSPAEFWSRLKNTQGKPVPLSKLHHRDLSGYYEKSEGAGGTLNKEGIDCAVQLNMDPIRHFAIMAQVAMKDGDYQKALDHLSMGLRKLPPQFPQYAAPLLAQRAECFWQLGNFQASVEDMMNAIHAGLPGDGLNSEKEALTWTSHGYSLLQEQSSYYLAEKCATIALKFEAYTPKVMAQPFLCRALSRHKLGDIPGAQRDIREIKIRDINFAKTSAQEQKDTAIKELQQCFYEESLKSFNLALLLYPEDRSKANFLSSVESHKAAAYFNLKKYRKALEVGEQSYKSNPMQLFTEEEAKAWTERGDVVSREPNSVDLAIDYYTLALNYTPPEKTDLKNIILSNQSLMYRKRESEEQARMFKAKGLEAARKGDNGKAIELLQLSLKHGESKINEQCQTLQLLCELLFKEKLFTDCLETGRKLKATYRGEKSEEIDSFRIEQANQWKEWGIELHKESKYDLMVEYFTLAMEFTPESNKEIMKALLSNRCLAFINSEKFSNALADAENCIKIKPQWFRVSRHFSLALSLTYSYAPFAEVRFRIVDPVVVVVIILELNTTGMSLNMQLRKIGDENFKSVLQSHAISDGFLGPETR